MSNYDARDMVRNLPHTSERLASLARGLAVICACGALIDIGTSGLRADEIDDEISAIARVGAEGAGSAEARKACDALGGRGAEILPRLLGALDTTNPVAANWYRAAFEAIVERELARARSGSLRVEPIMEFVRDAEHSGRARRLAIGLCERLDRKSAADWTARQLDDPEFRTDAVEMALAAGQRALEGGDSEAARDAFLKAFDHARSSAQCVRAADKLAALGEHVDIQAHLGLVVDWWVVGPFDAPGFSGFDRSFPPEENVDLAAHYSGQEGRELTWVRYRTSDPLGLVDLVKALAPAKEAVGYAYAELISPREQPAELRCGADDNCTVWLNGQKAFGRQQWLNGIRFDRFTTNVRLTRGTNRLLVKVCQGPPNKDPQVSNNWSLQLRFTDPSGAGIALRSALQADSGSAK